jgi:hypothetical protein
MKRRGSIVARRAAKLTTRLGSFTTLRSTLARRLGTLDRRLVTLARRVTKLARRVTKVARRFSPPERPFGVASVTNTSHGGASTAWYRGFPGGGTRATSLLTSLLMMAPLVAPFACTGSGDDCASSAAVVTGAW